MSDTVTVNGTKVQTGDTVVAKLDGVVRGINADYNEFQIQTDEGVRWIGGKGFKVEVTKKAGPVEPTAKNAVVQATDNYGSMDRFVKRSGKWYYLDIYGDATLKISYTWTELLNMYDSVTVLEADTKPSLPKDHKVRDLNFRQTYKRQYGDTITFNKGAASGGLDVANTYTMKKDEAIALAWDILKLYGQVQ